MPNLKALLFSIRNLYDFNVLQDKIVNPTHLNYKSARQSQFLSEKTHWRLENEEEFYKFHKILIPFNSCKSKFEFNLKNKNKVKK